MKKNTWIVIGLITCLVLTIGYIAVDKYQEQKQEEQLEFFQQGVQYGYEQTVSQLIQQASTCQQVPVVYENQTINLIAVECLQA